MKRRTVISKAYTVKPCKLKTDCVQNACKMKEQARNGKKSPQEKKSTCQRKMLFIPTCYVDDIVCTKYAAFLYATLHS